MRPFNKLENSVKLIDRQKAFREYNIYKHMRENVHRTVVLYDAAIDLWLGSRLCILWRPLYENNQRVRREQSDREAWPTLLS